MASGVGNDPARGRDFRGRHAVETAGLIARSGRTITPRRRHYYVTRIGGWPWFPDPREDAPCSNSGKSGSLEITGAATQFDEKAEPPAG